MTPEEMNLDMLVAELDRENRLLRARNERLEKAVSGAVSRLEKSLKGERISREELLKFMLSHSQ